MSGNPLAASSALRASTLGSLKGCSWPFFLLCLPTPTSATLRVYSTSYYACTLGHNLCSNHRHILNNLCHWPPCWLPDSNWIEGLSPFMNLISSDMSIPSSVFMGCFKFRRSSCLVGTNFIWSAMLEPLWPRMYKCGFSMDACKKKKKKKMDACTSTSSLSLALASSSERFMAGSYTPLRLKSIWP